MPFYIGTDDLIDSIIILAFKTLLFYRLYVHDGIPSLVIMFAWSIYLSIVSFNTNEVALFIYALLTISAAIMAYYSIFFEWDFGYSRISKKNHEETKEKERISKIEADLAIKEDKINKLKSQANDGDAQAQFLYAKHIYEQVSFYGIEIDDKLIHSINWIVKSANQGHNEAYQLARQILQKLNDEISRIPKQIDDSIKVELMNRKLGRVTRGLMSDVRKFESRQRTLESYRDMLQKLF